MKATAEIGPIARASRGLSARQKEALLGYAFLVPAFFFLLGLILYPAAYSVYFSFTDKVVGQAAHWVGLDNYVFVLNYPDFRLMVVHTVELAVVAVTIKVFIGTTMALALNENFPGRALIRAVLFLPWVIPSFVAGFLWRWLFDDQNGLFNWALLNLHLIPAPISWLGQTATAMPAVIAVVVWKGFPFFGITYLAGLQGISSEQYEAAMVDGASVFQRFRFITVPGLRHVMTVTIMLSLIWTSNTFDLVYIMTNGGPSNATQVFTLLTYNLGVAQGRIGDASVVPLMALPIFAGMIVILTRYMERSQA